jgi:hypothetical protein
MAERFGDEPPPEFYDRPEIEPHLIMLWNAFWELSTERQFGMAIGPIPVLKIREYLRDELGLEDIEYEHARAVIRRVDDAWCGMLNRRREDGPEMAETVKMTDGEGVKRLVRGFGKARRK